MADKNVNSHAYFYNSNGDRYYNADGMSDFLSPFFKQGVFNGMLQITANDNMTVSMAVGYAWVGLEGSTVKRLKHFTAIETFDIETASGTLDRFDTIVVRRNDTDRDITAEYVKGSLSSEPIPTVPTRSGAVYELVLAQIHIPAGTVKITQDMITDVRMNADLCGWVVSNITEVNFSQITAQFEAFFTAYEGNALTRYNAFNDYMALLQQQGDTKYSELVAAFTEYKDIQQSNFAEWFQSMKDQLSQDAAGNLQNEINTKEIEDIMKTGLVDGEIIKSNVNGIKTFTQTGSDGRKLVTTIENISGIKTYTVILHSKTGTQLAKTVTVKTASGFKTTKT